MASALVATTGVGGNRVYAYDASGQRVAQVRVDQFGPGAVALDATVYVDSVEARDEQPLAPGGVSAQRFVSFGGATVAVESTGDAGGSVWSLMLGDVQGSAQVMVDLVVSVTATGWASFDGVSHGVSRAAYTPFGASRGDGLDVSRGWLGQVEDAGTGLTYLNARYYDPATMRFISPDPLMNPGDPRTLDPYRYANNNPVAFTDASGLEPRVWDDGRVVGAPASSKTGARTTNTGGRPGKGAGMTQQQKDDLWSRHYGTGPTPTLDPPSFWHMLSIGQGTGYVFDSHQSDLARGATNYLVLACFLGLRCDEHTPGMGYGSDERLWIFHDGSTIASQFFGTTSFTSGVGTEFEAWLSEAQAALQEGQESYSSLPKGFSVRDSSVRTPGGDLLSAAQFNPHDAELTFAMVGSFSYQFQAYDYDPETDEFVARIVVSNIMTAPSLLDPRGAAYDPDEYSERLEAWNSTPVMNSQYMILITQNVYHVGDLSWP